MHSRTIGLIGGLLGAFACGPSATSPPAPPAVVSVLLHDLSTNVTEAPRVVMEALPRGPDGIPITDAASIEAGVREGVSVVRWPSRALVPGRWEVVHEYFEMRFVRDAAAGPEWEAVILDRAAIGARLPGVDAVEPVTIARYSPSSRPIVVSVATASGDGGTTLFLEFSELIGFSRDVHPLVRIDLAGCVPLHVATTMESVLRWTCPPIADGTRLLVRMDGSLTATAGGSIAYAYGRAPGTEVALDLTLRRDAGASHDAPLTADRATLETASGIAPVTR